VIGAQKAGTTALFDYLLQNPALDGCKYKEAHYFDVSWGKGDRWYAAQFPLKPRWRLRDRSRSLLIGEATPGYLFDPRIPARLHSYAPDARLVVVLRDPVRRALSHYHEARAIGAEELTFEAALAAEPGRLAGELERMRAEPTYTSSRRMLYSYVERGFYLRQIEWWLERYAREQLLVIVSEDLRDEPLVEVRRVEGHLGAPAWAATSFPTVNARSYEGMAPALELRLAETFAGENERLYAFLGRDLGWTAPR
jgi:hypothetical protein